jgi:hypothetical protein
MQTWRSSDDPNPSAMGLRSNALRQTAQAAIVPTVFDLGHSRNYVRLGRRPLREIYLAALGKPEKKLQYIYFGLERHIGTVQILLAGTEVFSSSLRNIQEKKRRTHPEEGLKRCWA